MGQVLKAIEIAVNSNTTLVKVKLGKQYLAEFIMENSNTTLVKVK